MSDPTPSATLAQNAALIQAVRDNPKLVAFGMPSLAPIEIALSGPRTRPASSEQPLSIGSEFDGKIAKTA